MLPFSHQSSRRPLGAALFLAAASLSSAACRSPATEVLVTVGSDAPATRAFHVRVIARTSGDSAGAVNVITRASDAGEALGSFAVVPPAGRPLGEPVTLVFEASLAPGGPSEPAQEWRRTVRFTFVQHATLSLPVFLPVYCGNHSDGCTTVASADCTVSVRCEERGLTCGDRGACVATDVMPTIADAGLDAASDATAPLDDCAVTTSSAPSVLADFEDRMVPVAGTRPVGFVASQASQLAIIDGGAQGTSAAAHVTFGASRTIAIEGATARQYLSGGATLNEQFGNAIEFDIRVPAGSMLLSDAPRAQNLTAATAHWRPGDLSVGAIPDSAMQNFAPFAIQTAGADRWLHVVLGPAAFTVSRDYYHFLSAAAGSDELPFVPSVRQFRLDEADSVASGSFDLDEVRVISLPPVARVCPTFTTRSVSAGGGDVLIPIDISNPTTRSRSYRMYLSSEIHVAREDQLRAYAAAGFASATADITLVNSTDGGRGAVDLFEADATGHPTGPSLTVAGGSGVVVASGGVFHGVLVHHIVPAMLGTPNTNVYGTTSITTRRDTLTTSLLVWDPDEPSRESPEVRHAGSNADEPRVSSVAPGFPPSAVPPLGWSSLDIRVDEGVGTFVSILRLTP